MKIKQTKTDTLTSVEKDKYLDLKMERSGRKLPYPFFRTNLDQYELYLKEMAGCDKFRLITTIRPYCTNVLFNPLTEVVNKGEPTQKIQNWLTNAASFHKEYVWSTTKSSDPRCKYMVGGDIFSNHLLRNNSFKAVNWGNTSDVSYNTMNDAHRGRSKNVIENQLYGYGDCMPYLLDKDDNELYTCINYELHELDGWYGFYNKTNVETSSNRSYTDKTKNCSRVLNDKAGGEFVELYPDKKLFLFNPVFNEDKYRNEYNWDICLTYPYANYVGNELVEEDGWNGLKVKSVIGENIETPNGGKGYLITTYIPHNLQLGEKFTLSYKKDGEVFEPYTENGVYLSVMKLGDEKGKNKEYTVLVSEEAMNSAYSDLINDGDGYVSDNDLNAIAFRLRKLRKQTESVYYFRIFRKLPNFKYATRYLDLETVKTDIGSYLDELEDNGVGFDHELYPLGFSNTVYNDANTQMTVTDTITPDMLVDNLGRPLTEFYTTIVKTNRGHEEWYRANPDINNDAIECSHCFGEVSMGLRCMEKLRSTDVSDDIEMKYDIRNIDDTRDDGEKINGLSFECEGESFETVLSSDKFFLGDIVEFNHDMVKEYVLADVMHRFNTWQRENIDENGYQWSYEDIGSDDRYKTEITYTDPHKEGYYYKAHYRMPLKEFGEIKSGEHKQLKLSCINRYDRKGDSDKAAVDADNHDCYLMRVVNKHSVTVGDSVRVELGDKFYKMTIFYIPNSKSFVVDSSRAKTTLASNGVVWKDVTEEELTVLKTYLQDKTVKWMEQANLWIEDPSVPWYAVRHPKFKNRYLWREIYTYGDIRCAELDNTVVFANNHIYLNQEIDFFLRRQDPYGKYGKLYIGDVPDVVGDKAEEPPLKVTPFNDIVC